MRSALAPADMQSRNNQADLIFALLIFASTLLMASSHDDVASRRIGAVCFLVDVVLIIAIVVQNHSHFVSPPTTGIDASATIGWLSVVAAIIIFGCYGYVAVSS